jgi:hypothetical protein
MSSKPDGPPTRSRGWDLGIRVIRILTSDASKVLGMVVATALLFASRGTGRWMLRPLGLFAAAFILLILGAQLLIVRREEQLRRLTSGLAACAVGALFHFAGQLETLGAFRGWLAGTSIIAVAAGTILLAREAFAAYKAASR